jgi:hypothetical protein
VDDHEEMVLIGWFGVAAGIGAVVAGEVEDGLGEVGSAAAEPRRLVWNLMGVGLVQAPVERWFQVNVEKGFSPIVLESASSRPDRQLNTRCHLILKNHFLSPLPHIHTCPTQLSQFLFRLPLAALPIQR